MAETTPIPKRPRDTAPFPPFQSEHFPSQLFWLAVSFVLLYVLMSRIALPRIGAIFGRAQPSASATISPRRNG